MAFKAELRVYVSGQAASYERSKAIHQESGPLTSGTKAASSVGRAARLKPCPAWLPHCEGEDALATAGGTPALRSFFREAVPFPFVKSTLRLMS